MVGALGVEVAGVDGADAEELEPLEEEDEPVELVVDVVPVVLVCVALLFEAGAAVDVGTVNGGTSDVSAVVEPLPQATRPTDNATPLKRAMANFRMLVGGT